MKIDLNDTTMEVALVAVSDLNPTNRKPGFGASGWTVYYAKDGGAATSMTTPTIRELSTINMPGDYYLAVDEPGMVDTKGELVIHISHADMAEVTRVIEIRDPADFKATGFSTHNAANVWAVGTKEITGGTVGTCTTNTDMRGTDSASTHSLLDVIGTAGWTVYAHAVAMQAYLDAVEANIRGGSDTLDTLSGQVDGTSTHDAAAVSAAITAAHGTGSYLSATGFSTHDAAAVKTAIEAAGSHLALIKTDVDGLNGAAMRGTDSASTHDAAAVKTAIEAVGSVLDQILTDVTGIDGAAMRGTNSAALATVCTEIRLSELAAANLPADIDTVKAKVQYLPESFQKNTEVADFHFVMKDSSGDAVTGESVTAQYIHGAGVLSCDNAVAEIGSGAYRIVLSASDMNADFITLIFSADNSQTLFLHLKTEP